MKLSLALTEAGQEEFSQYAQEARTGCIISRALGGVEEINLSAALAS